MEALRKERLLPVNTSSCRPLCGEAMCSKEGLDILSTDTWSKACPLGSCDKCPKLIIKVPNKLTQKKVTVPQWEIRKSKTKKDKKVNSLWPVEMTMQEVVDKLKEKVPGLKGHIFRAANQWRCCKADIENIQPGTVLTIEDYQMNLVVQFFETTTTSFMGTNQEQRMMFPILIALR